jgi:hypothetical protein
LNFLVQRRKKGLLKWWDEEETITHGQVGKGGEGREERNEGMGGRDGRRG